MEGGGPEPQSSCCNLVQCQCVSNLSRHESNSCSLTGCKCGNAPRPLLRFTLVYTFCGVSVVLQEGTVSFFHLWSICFSFNSCKQKPALSLRRHTSSQKSFTVAGVATCFKRKRYLQTTPRCFFFCLAPQFGILKDVTIVSCGA